MNNIDQYMHCITTRKEKIQNKTQNLQLLFRDNHDYSINR